MHKYEALTVAILALNTYLHPEATGVEEERVLEHGADRAIEALARLRDTWATT